MRWSPEADAQILTLYRRGDSASEIARAFGMGVSRNSIIGRIHRLGAVDPNRQQVGRESAGVKQKVAANMVRATKPLPKPKPSPTQPLRRLSIIELGFSTCRWPINTWLLGEGYTAQFCGAPKDLGSAYCAKCRARSVVHHQPRPTAA